jgi:hypothetical protein
LFENFCPKTLGPKFDLKNRHLKISPNLSLPVNKEMSSDELFGGRVVGDGVVCGVVDAKLNLVVTLIALRNPNEKV